MDRMNYPTRSDLKTIITYIVRCGTVDQGALCLKIESMCNQLNIEKNQLVGILRSTPTIFILKNNDSDVELIIPTKLCPKFCSASGCIDKECPMFHICKFYVLSNSCHKKQPNPCKFSHNLQDREHNQNLIYKWILDDLHLKDLRVLFCLSRNRTAATIPKICHHYALGHRCDKGKKCPGLHICKQYVWGDCPFNESCKKSHDIADIKDILKRYGINIEQTPTYILNTLKCLYKNLGHAPSSAGNICLFQLRGRCLYGKNCRYKHKNKAFQWQHRDDKGTWIDFPEDVNEQIEKKYCSPKFEDYFYQMVGEICKIDFADLNKSDEEIRRLSTIDYSSNSNFMHRPWTTKWLWYWKSENGWIQYGRPDDAGYKSKITSKEIEDEFSNNADGKIEIHSNVGLSYILDFTKMIQQNKTYGTERKVLRRPEFVDEEVMKERKKEVELLKKAKQLKMPDTWEMPTGSDIFSHFQMIEVETASPEYQDVKRDFEQSNTDGSKVTSVRRVENVELWRAFNEYKKTLSRKLRREIEPMRLFHGTSGDLVQGIAKQGFDCRLAGSKVGHLYGKGGYFGKTSSVSANYCDKENKMFVAKVLIGDVTRGTKEMLRPPPKNPAEPHGELYDTTVDDPSDPKIFVKFDNNHIYPEYVITFK